MPSRGLIGNAILENRLEEEAANRVEEAAAKLGGDEEPIETKKTNDSEKEKIEKEGMDEEIHEEKPKPKAQTAITPFSRKML